MGNIEIRHIAWNFETENSFNLAVKRQSSDNSTPSYIIPLMSDPKGNS